jgi:D-arabinose 5-phosphate isomerase GutQ
MGKNYEEELTRIPHTARWAADVDLSLWAPAIADLEGRPLVVVASGGSVVAAQLLAQLHTECTGHPALVMTPLELLASDQPLDAAVWILSAGGGNSDILRGWEVASHRGARPIALLCGAPHSELAQRARKAKVKANVLIEVPGGRDGFLATNSLMAFFVVILRLYGIPIDPVEARTTHEVRASGLDRTTLLVLYGGWLKPIALDIESRFSEAALGNVQIVDFRNFAHGRHLWLAKRGPETTVLALISPDFAALAQDTLAQLPAEVAVQAWRYERHDAPVVLGALCDSMQLAAQAGRRLGYDPGRPSVPAFGERIYELRTSVVRTFHPSNEALACSRKQRVRAGANSQSTLLERGLQRFTTALASAEFKGAVLDYDGTLVATSHRFDPLEPPMSAELNRLLHEGLDLGIATGRGKSVHAHLRQAIAKPYWERVWIGYYNGSVIRTLAEHCDHLSDKIQDPDIRQAHEILRAAGDLADASIDARPTQITVSRPESDEHGLWKRVSAVLERSQITSLKVTHSSHSVDVIPRTASKVAVVATLAAAMGTHETAILKIGDRGRWPGNDAELLALSHGLSVDEVSWAVDACWNLAPQGTSGPLGTLFYLTRLKSGRYQLS